MIQTERICELNNKPVTDGVYVAYWMQASQRADCNHALEYAILKANDLHKPLIVFFGLTDSFPDANQRHYAFMLQGLREVSSALKHRGIKFVLRQRSPELMAIEIAKDACIMIVDRGYLRLQRHWREFVAERVSIPLTQVESDVLIPVETASPKEEFSAATFRPKFHRLLEYYIVPLKQEKTAINSLGLELDSLDTRDPNRLLSRMAIDRSVPASEFYIGGTTAAREHFDRFMEHRLDDYGTSANDPNAASQSNLSPYLHFGQISPLEIILRMRSITSPGKQDFLEQLMVRRELAVNFVFYNPHYDQFQCLPDWALQTLSAHANDSRPYLYTMSELEQAGTHDPYWNAAQQEMQRSGKMHGYMRMYWGKKIIEWSRTPEEAYQTALYLNNKYELDGRDPNGFAGVAWCFGKHDRPWGERPIFGKVRYMNENGLKRKFDMQKYVDMAGMATKNKPFH